MSYGLHLIACTFCKQVGIYPPQSPLVSYGVHTSPDQPQNAEFCPPRPPILGEPESQSPPILGDLGGEKDMCVHGSLGKGGSKNSPAPSPYKRGGLGWGLFLALRQLKHNFELDIGDSLTA